MWLGSIGLLARDYWDRKRKKNSWQLTKKTSVFQNKQKTLFTDKIFSEGFIFKVPETPASTTKLSEKTSGISSASPQVRPSQKIRRITDFFKKKP